MQKETAQREDVSMRKQLHQKGLQLNSKSQLLNMIEQNTERTQMLCRRSSNTGSKSGYNQRLDCALFTNILIKDLGNPFHPAFTCCILQSIVHEVEQIQVAVKLNGGQLKHKKKRKASSTGAQKEISGAKR